MGLKNPYYIEYLSNEMTRRAEANPAQSLRSFAKDLDIDPSQLSKILSRKIVPSLKITEKIINKLPISDNERIDFAKSVAEELKCRAIDYLEPTQSDCEK